MSIQRFHRVDQQFGADLFGSGCWFFQCYHLLLEFRGKPTPSWIAQTSRRHEVGSNHYLYKPFEMLKQLPRQSSPTKIKTAVTPRVVLDTPPFYFLPDRNKFFTKKIATNDQIVFSSHTDSGRVPLQHTTIRNSHHIYPHHSLIS